MTGSAQNVFAAARAQQGRQGPRLLVTGRTVRTPDGPRQKRLCYLGELNSSAQARWLKTVEVFNQQGETEQLKLFPSDVEPPEDDPQVARVLLNKVHLERTRQFGSCWLGLEVWKRLELDRFFERILDHEPADVP